MNYATPRVLDGSYPVTLTATDRSGYITTIQLLLTVDSAETNNSRKLNSNTGKIRIHS
jgi:hypothetical protein